MTIPIHMRENVARYSRINGYKNLGFLTGTLIDVKDIPGQEEIKGAIWLLPAGITNPHHAMPILLDPDRGVHLPSGVFSGSAIHARVRLEAGIILTDTRSVIPRALFFERPNILNSPSSELIETASKKVIESPDDGPIKPLSESVIETMNPVGSQNRVGVAGYVFWKSLHTTGTGRLCVSMLLMQSGDDTKAIHARMIAATERGRSILKVYYQKLEIGKAYELAGTFRINVTDEPEEGLKKFGYLDVKSIHPVQPGHDVPAQTPAWVDQYKERLKEQAHARRQSPPAAPQDTEGA